TCPTALARLKRLAGSIANWTVPSITGGDKTPIAKVAGKQAVSDNDRLVLEAFDFAAAEDAGVAAIAQWLAENALPQADEYAYFRNKLKEDFAVLPDAEFGHFVRNATVVEPHVRIDDATGTAEGGGLFYTENLPPATLLAGLVPASVERRTRGAN